MKRSGDFCGGDTLEKQAKTDLQGSEVPDDSEKPSFSTSESSIFPEDQLQALSNSFKCIFEGEPEETKKSFASIYDQAHLLVVNGRLTELLNCLKGAADDYLSGKATQLTGLIGMDLIKTLNALWLKYQSATNFIRLCFNSSSAHPNDEAGDLLLKAFKYNIVMPEEFKRRHDFDFYMKDCSPVLHIYTALLGTLAIVDFAPFNLEGSILETQLRVTVTMLRTLEALGYFRVAEKTSGGMFLGHVNGPWFKNL
jgi:hypothetical protein